MTFLKRLFGASKASGAATAGATDNLGVDGNQECRESAIFSPVGFLPYTATDFQRHFGVSKTTARQIADDYAEVIAFDKSSGFGAQLRSDPRNGPLVAKLCAGRYDVPDNIASAVHLFFVFVAIARENQIKMRGVRFTKAEWVGSTKADGSPCHPEFNGKT